MRDNQFNHIKYLYMDHISSIFKKNIINFFILLICIMLVEINSLHVIIPYV
jgi:hypothetical protein